jgi:hypothetical protein
MSSVFESIGFTMQSDKYKYGQQVLFLGILIDSTTMTVRIDAVVAKSFRLELEIYLDTTVIICNTQWIVDRCDPDEEIQMDYTIVDAQVMG